MSAFGLKQQKIRGLLQKTQATDAKEAATAITTTNSEKGQNLRLVVAVLVVIVGSLLGYIINDVSKKETQILPDISATYARDFPEENKTIWCPFSSNAVEVS
jgi:hypothetical protein